MWSQEFYRVLLRYHQKSLGRKNDDTRDVEFRRYHADMTAVEAMSGAAFMDKCYAWVMTQEDMAGSIAV